MFLVHMIGVVGLSLVQQWQERPRPKLEPTRVSIQLVRATPPPLPKPAVPSTPTPQLRLPKPTSPALPETPNTARAQPIPELVQPTIQEVPVPQTATPKLEIPKINQNIPAPNLIAAAPVAPTSAPIPEVKVTRPQQQIVSPKLPEVKTPTLAAPANTGQAANLPVPTIPRATTVQPTLPPLQAPKPSAAIPKPALGSAPAPEVTRLETRQVAAGVGFDAPQWETDPTLENAPQLNVPDLRESVLLDARNSAEFLPPDTEITAPESTSLTPEPVDILPSTPLRSAISSKEDLSQLPESTLPAMAQPNSVVQPPTTERLPEPPRSTPVPPVNPNPRLPQPKTTTPGIVAGLPSNGPKLKDLAPKISRNDPPPPPPPPVPKGDSNLFAGSTQNNAPPPPLTFDPKTPPPTVASAPKTDFSVQNIQLQSELQNQEAKRREVERSYNSLLRDQLRGQINAGPQPFDEDLELAIQLHINAEGQVIQFQIKKGSGSDRFDRAVLTGLKALQFPRLPEELAENPPYIVTVRVQP